MEKQNAKVPAQIYYARHMQQGVAKYDSEMILVTEDAIKQMMPSFNGKPVYVFHVDEIDLENAHGYVTETFYNELDGWVWSKIILTDEVALEAVNKGWAVSNAYIPTEYSRGGTHHNVEYDRKILNGDYTHLAIVPNPRYEDACIMSPDDYKAYCMSKKAQLDELKNSKNVNPKKGNLMFFKMKKEEVSSIDEDTMVEIKNDDGTVTEVSVFEMRDALLNAKKNEAEEEEKINMDAEIDVGDEKMTVKELINRYTKTKKNEADEDKEKSNEDDEKENSEDEDEKENEADEDEKKNSHFEELKNANKVKADKAPSYMSHADRLAVGKAKY